MEEKDTDEISVGDLVRLVDDHEFLIGIGLVVDKASDTGTALDEFFGLFDFYQNSDESAFDDEDLLFLNRPVYLVIWSGDNKYFSSDSSAKPLWFFKNELKVVNKGKL